METCTTTLLLGGKQCKLLLTDVTVHGLCSKLTRVACSYEVLEENFTCVAP